MEQYLSKKEREQRIKDIQVHVFKKYGLRIPTRVCIAHLQNEGVVNPKQFCPKTRPLPPGYYNPAIIIPENA
jgi:hypothetical protein